ncbi:S9 family peptidase [Massilia sp. BJB1822]|uniref:S9 family peptidase n=1 Tax=Massilia sp. BJB1822 TaxID=2744470 RepID=UPI0015938282|nr:S9 family peptidase [Massilia sp. BJB1822]NVD97417.1 S9 family peptidase [Massilia sp. BJB1822]
MRLIHRAARLTALALLLQCAFAPMSSQAASVARSVQKTPKKYSIEQFMATTSISGASFSHDEKNILFSSNESGIFNVYSIPVGGGKPVALTKSTVDSHYAVSYFRHDDRILFTRDKGGDEQNHLFVRELDGTEKDLTPGEKLKAAFAGWSQDGKAFYVQSNERDPKYFDLYRYDAKTYERSLLYKTESSLRPVDVSRDGKWIALDKPNTTADSDIYLYNVASQETKHITPHQGTASYNTATFDPASSKLFFTSNDGGEFTSLRSYDLASGKVSEHEKARWDVMGTDFSHNGRFRVTAINQDGTIVQRIVEGAQEKPLVLPKLQGGEMRGATFSDSGNLLAFYVNGDRSPNNLFVYDLRSKKLNQLTQSLNKEIDANDLVEAEVVRFKSFDGVEIPSIFLKPKGASLTNKVPAVVFVHGGPGGQTRRGYNPLFQYLANKGYAVLGINNRGSSGYGKTFYTADDGKHGREPLWDCVEAKTYLASLGYIDPDRIGIMGGSYGGYMTLAALAFRPEAFKVGIDIFGVSNWVRTLESIPPYWEAQRKALYAEIGDPVKDKEFLIETSPLFHAKHIRKPLMVIQGKNDPRVIKPESDEIVEAVKKNQVPVEYVVFDDEGHGFSKKKNQIEANGKMVEFLDKYLKPGLPAAK